MNTRVLKAVAPLVLLVALLGGCSGDSSERQRIVLEVVTVNAGNPLVAAYQEQDETDVYYTLDSVPVVFHARPYNQSMTIPTDGAYSSFVITGYNLVWHPGANVPAGLDLSQFNVENVPFFVQVPVGDDAGSSLMVADRVIKEGIGAVLGTPWTLSQDFTAYLEMQFIGHASGDEHEVIVPAGLGVSFTFALSRN
ncbi:MAG: hypothetical protein ABR506_05945 [Candidatus Krumholzibacteriia bacterium]